MVSFRPNYRNAVLLLQTQWLLETHIFKNGSIKVVSNKGWYFKGVPAHNFGEQPIDVAYTILALNTFYETFGIEEYRTKMEIAFDWFHGKNHLKQIVYNPKTGGCHDGVEEDHINLNQGAESTLSYLMARLVFEGLLNSKSKIVELPPRQKLYNI